MTTQLTLAEFAVWSRRAGVSVPYPIDLSAVAGAGVALPDESRELATLRRVLGAARLSVFMLRADPETITRCAVAVASDHEALLVHVDDHVRIREIGASDLVSALGSVLPDLVPLATGPTELTEAAWTRVLAAVRTPGRVDERALTDVGLPNSVVNAMVADADHRAPVGVAGAMAWPSGQSSPGPTVASWQEFATGTVLTHVLAPRRLPGPTRIVVGPYSVADVLRTVTEAVSTVQYRNR